MHQKHPPAKVAIAVWPSSFIVTLLVSEVRFGYLLDSGSEAGDPRFPGFDAQPTYTFSYSPKEGYRGLVTDKRAVLVYARGGEYPPGTDGEAFDLQKRYMETILGFIGFSDI